MKKTLAAAAVALAGAAGAANAADMYAGGMKDVAFVPPPLWTGLYIGAHVGGAWADLDTADRFGVFGPVDFEMEGLRFGRHRRRPDRL